MFAVVEHIGLNVPAKPCYLPCLASALNTQTACASSGYVLDLCIGVELGIVGRALPVALYLLENIIVPLERVGEWMTAMTMDYLM